MLLSIALILLVGMSMGWICRKIKLPGLLGNVDYRYCARSVCVKYAGYKASWHIGRFKKNRPDYYSDKGGAWTGFNELKKNRKTGGFNVLCAGNV